MVLLSCLVSHYHQTRYISLSIKALGFNLQGYSTNYLLDHTNYLTLLFDSQNKTLLESNFYDIT